MIMTIMRRKSMITTETVMIKRIQEDKMKPNEMWSRGKKEKIIQESQPYMTFLHYSCMTQGNEKERRKERDDKEEVTREYHIKRNQHEIKSSQEIESSREGRILPKQSITWHQHHFLPLSYHFMPTHNTYPTPPSRAHFPPFKTYDLPFPFFLCYSPPVYPWLNLLHTPVSKSSMCSW